MVSVRWCLQQKNGLELTEPNDNMSDSYIKMADESVVALQNVRDSKIWTATTAYYIFYYSLYSLMLKIGVKCEIHSCSLAFMRTHLAEFYNRKDMELIQKSFTARIDLQYYADRPVDSAIIEEVRKYCKIFLIKTKDVLSKITENQVKNIREELQKTLKVNSEA